MPARSTAALIATLPSWCAASALKSPSRPPIGVRAAETMTMESAMVELLRMIKRAKTIRLRAVRRIAKRFCAS